MNVACAVCKTTYRVDPAKVPATGVRARCSRCGGVISVARESGAPASAPAAPAPNPAQATAVAPRSAPATPRAAAQAPEQRPPSTAPQPGRPAQQQAQPLQSPRPPQAPSAAPPTRPAPAADGARPTGQAPPRTQAAAPAPRPTPVFGSADPDAKARRLARALISDIVVYHPDRRERSMAAGTLREEFREEIQKSWEEYASQVGDETARGTPHFRDALNDVLAGGERVF